MNEETILDIARNTITLGLLVAAPALIAALAAGLIISVFQAATQINEQTLSFIPKIIIMLAAMVICGPWIVQKMMGFTVELFKEIPNFAH